MSQLSVGPKKAESCSSGAYGDSGIAPNDRLSFSYQHYFIDFLVLNRSLTFTINRVNPGDFTPFETRGAPGQGQLQLSNTFRDRTNSTISPSLVWRHDGPVWKLEAGLGVSIGRNTFRDIDKGYFVGSVAQRTGVTIGFADIFYLRPRAITVTDAAGAPVDPYSISTYAVTQTSANPLTNHDLQQGAYANVGRTFDFRLPVTLKAGLDLRRTNHEARRGDHTSRSVLAYWRHPTPAEGGRAAAPPYFARVLPRAQTSCRYSPVSRFY